MRYNGKTRQQFLRELTAHTALLGAVATLAPEQSRAGASRKPSLIPQRPLGNTGRMVGIYSLGAQATVEQVGMRDQAIEIVNRCIDLGINYIDTSAVYGQNGTAKKTTEMQGTSERHVGEVMKTRRQEVYLATKTHDRTYDGSMRLLEKSLNNLQTDHIDLWQIHNIRDTHA